MDIKEYKAKKIKGLAEVVKAGGGYAFAVKRFNPDDGIEISPEIESINRDDLVIKKANLEAELLDCIDLIADVDNIVHVEKI